MAQGGGVHGFWGFRGCRDLDLGFRDLGYRHRVEDLGI